MDLKFSNWPFPLSSGGISRPETAKKQTKDVLWTSRQLFEKLICISKS